MEASLVTFIVYFLLYTANSCVLDCSVATVHYAMSATIPHLGFGSLPTVEQCVVDEHD